MHQILFNATVPTAAQRFRLTQDPGWHYEAILRISALSHNYRGVDGAAAGLELGGAAIQPGDRAPDCRLSADPPRSDASTTSVATRVSRCSSCPARAMARWTPPGPSLTPT